MTRYRTFEQRLAAATGRVLVAAAICVAGSFAALGGHATPAGATTATVQRLCYSAAYSCDSTGYQGQPTWGFQGPHNCTDYAAWRLAHNGAPQPAYNLGNATTWASAAAAHGVTVNHTPAVGAVAQWNAYTAWAANKYGHVGYVQAVGSNFIDVVADNYVPNAAGHMDTWRFFAGSPDWPSNFIHFADQAASWGGVGSATFVGSDRLAAGARLYPGQYLASPDLRSVLELQTDGNLVEYVNGGSVLFNSGTAGQAIAFAVMQGDGNFVLYRTDNSAAWSTGTGGGAARVLVLQDDAHIVLYTPSFVPVWASATTIPAGLGYAGSDRLSATGMSTLSTNQYLRSVDKRFALLLQSDGNLVLYGPGYHVLWNAGTAGSGSVHAVMQTDGNFVLYRGDWSAAWSTRTGGTAGTFSVVQTDGNFVVYTAANVPTWSTGTGGRI